MTKTIKKAFIKSVLLCVVLFLASPSAYTVLAEGPSNSADKVQKKDVAEKKKTEDKEDIAEPPSGPNVDIDKVTKEIEIDTPASVTGQKIDGTGTVTDFSTTGSKAFYTIKDNEQNIFYLIIDLDKTENNVYFLSDIKKSELEESGASGDSKEVVSNEPVEQVDSIKMEESKEESGNGFLLAVLLIAAIGVAAYYFLVMKKRHNNKGKDEDDMMEDYEDEDVYNGEEENENTKDEN